MKTKKPKSNGLWLASLLMLLASLLVQCAPIGQPIKGTFGHIEDKVHPDDLKKIDQGREGTPAEDNPVPHVSGTREYKQLETYELPQEVVDLIPDATAPAKTRMKIHNPILKVNKDLKSLTFSFEVEIPGEKKEALVLEGTYNPLESVLHADLFPQDEKIAMQRRVQAVAACLDDGFCKNIAVRIYYDYKGETLEEQVESKKSLISALVVNEEQTDTTDSDTQTQSQPQQQQQQQQQQAQPNKSHQETTPAQDQPGPKDQEVKPLPVSPPKPEHPPEEQVPAAPALPAPQPAPQSWPQAEPPGAEPDPKSMFEKFTDLLSDTFKSDKPTPAPLPTTKPDALPEVPKPADPAPTQSTPPLTIPEPHPAPVPVPQPEPVPAPTPAPVKPSPATPAPPASSAPAPKKESVFKDLTKSDAPIAVQLPTPLPAPKMDDARSIPGLKNKIFNPNSNAHIKYQSIGHHEGGALRDASQMPGRTKGLLSTASLAASFKWGNERFIDALIKASEEVNEKYPNRRPIEINAISKQAGGFTVPGQRSHQNGLDADVFWPGKTTGDRSPVADAELDRTFDFMKSMVCADRSHISLFFVDASIKHRLCLYAKKSFPEQIKNPKSCEYRTLWAMMHWSGHVDHLHIRSACPRYDKCAPNDNRRECIYNYCQERFIRPNTGHNIGC